MGQQYALEEPVLDGSIAPKAVIKDAAWTARSLI